MRSHAVCEQTQRVADRPAVDAPATATGAHGCTPTPRPPDRLDGLVARSVLDRAVLQRFVMERASQFGWRWNSSWEPRTLYDTEQAAKVADDRLERQNRGLVAYVAEARVPTLYTYTNTRVTSQITGTPQGPHTASHVHVSTALGRLAGRESLLAVFYEQVPWPEQVVQMLCTEKNCQPAALDMALQRFSFDYNGLYVATERALWSTAAPIPFVQTAIAAILTMNPYATYAWKSGKPASKKATRGKGERGTKPFAGAVDPRAQFVDKEAYGKFLEDRAALVAGEYEYEEDEYGDEQLNEGIYDMDALLSSVDASQVGEEVSIWPSGEWIIASLRMDGATPVAVRLQRPP